MKLKHMKVWRCSPKAWCPHKISFKTIDWFEH